LAEVVEVCPPIHLHVGAQRLVACVAAVGQRLPFLVVAHQNLLPDEVPCLFPRVVMITSSSHLVALSVVVATGVKVSAVVVVRRLAISYVAPQSPELTVREVVVLVGPAVRPSPKSF